MYGILSIGIVEMMDRLLSLDPALSLIAYQAYADYRHSAVQLKTISDFVKTLPHTNILAIPTLEIPPEVLPPKQPSAVSSSKSPTSSSNASSLVFGDEEDVSP